MQTTGNDLIASALRLINALASGEVPSAAEANDALLTLNMMLDAWAIDRLTIYNIASQDFALTATQQAYTLGTGGNFNAARPPKISRVSIVILSNPVNPLELDMDYTTSEEEWQDIQLKATSSTYPSLCYDDAAYPLRNLSLWPVPNDSTSKLRIYSWVALSQFADLVTSYNFPPGYAEAIRFNLALRLSPEFGGNMPESVPALAQQALAKIKTANVPVNKLKCDDAVVGGTAAGANYRQELFNIP
jgi:hypothetical protein